MSQSTIQTSNLVLPHTFRTRNGAKQLPALYKNGEPVVFQSNETHEVRFEPSAFNDVDATRVTLYITPSASLCDTITALDEWCIDIFTGQSRTLIGVQLTPEQVRERYVSYLKTSKKG